MNDPIHPADVFPECQPVLEVRDVQEAIEWYQEKLGFEVDFTVEDPPTYACIGRSFSGLGAATLIRFVSWYRDRNKLANSGWLAIYVGESIDDLYQQIVKADVTISKEIEDQPYGMREFEIRDGNGHYLRFGCIIESSS